MKKTIFPIIFLSLCYLFTGCKNTGTALNVSFVSSNLRFVEGQDHNPTNKENWSKTRAWKGERTHLQVMILYSLGIGLRISDMKI